MPNKSPLESEKELKPIEPSSQRESVNPEQEDASGAASSIYKTSGGRQRKTALSKREMMEELSKQRFPWDE